MPVESQRMTDQEHSFLELLAFIFLQNARPDKAMVLLQALDLIAPLKPKVLSALALSQLRAEKPQQALATLDRLAMAGGIDAAFHLLRGQALMNLGRAEEAALAMQNFVEIRRVNVSANTANTANTARKAQ
jgi:Flp pilus assembly protein TadD